jgi:HD-like signal output (HDOD) protein
MSELIQEVRAELLDAIAKDRLVLPTLPEVALKVREAASNPDIEIAELTKVVESDPAMAARIIKVANSPLLRASRAIEDLKMAVARLGIQYTSNLATSLAMQQMFQATSDLIDQQMRDNWAKSTEVASIAHVLARHYTKLKPDQATLAGIIHRIGVLPILTYAEANRKLLRDPTVLQAVIDELHPMIGKRIVETWNFPKDLIIVPEEHLQFDRVVPTADYADVIMIANLQSYTGTDHPLATMDCSGISAFARLGLSPDMNTEDDEDLSAEMEAAMALLNS